MMKRSHSCADLLDVKNKKKKQCDGEEEGSGGGEGSADHEDAKIVYPEGDKDAVVGTRQAFYDMMQNLFGHRGKSVETAPAAMDFITVDTEVVIERVLIGNKRLQRCIALSDTEIIVSECSGEDPIISMDLAEVTVKSQRSAKDVKMFLYSKESTVLVIIEDMTLAESWLKDLKSRILVARTLLTAAANRGLSNLLEVVNEPKKSIIDGESNNCGDNDSKLTSSKDNDPLIACRGSFSPNVEGFQTNPITPPAMHIVILAVGTHGDVQPFINFGVALQEREHHIVRIATHSQYRYCVESAGLRFFPLKGDPRQLSSHMVKTGGRLIPDIFNLHELQEVPEKIHMLKEITYSTWPACTQADPGDPKQEPFMADAIISNPISFGHIHCAEALAVPLHIMFPQPCFPTKSFPHPLSNLHYGDTWSSKNYLSYFLVENLLWVGMQHMINHFRKDVLSLPPIRLGTSEGSIVGNDRIPVSHIWSPSFVPKCIDWPSHVDVVGDFTKPKGGDPTHDALDSRLLAFLKKYDSDNQPIFIGFGSMVIADHHRLLQLITVTVVRTGFPVILQNGWSTFGAEYEKLTEDVLVVGPMSHDHLFQLVSGAIHHGGAGTTSASLRCGKPTFVCPFFGDQYFWAEMVHRAGVGPPGCDINKLSVDLLERAFYVLRNPAVCEAAKRMGEKMALERGGIATGIASFYRNLPLKDMLCEVSIFNGKSRKAQVYCEDCGLKMSQSIDAMIHNNRGSRRNHVRMPYRSVDWGVAPSSFLEGLGQGIGGVAYEVAAGLGHLIADPIRGARASGLTGCAAGVVSGVTAAVARPLTGGGVFITKISEGSAGRSFPINKALRHSVDTVFSYISPSSEKSIDATEESESSCPSTAQQKDSQDEKLPEETHKLATAKVEEALYRAIKFRSFYSALVTSENKTITALELQKIIPECDAEALLKVIDRWHEGCISFTELALNCV